MLKWLLVFFLFCTPSFAQNNPGVIVKGTVTPNNCPKFLNAWTLEDSGTTCGGGSGTVSTGTAGNIAFYQSTGSTVIGTSAIDINTSTWNVGIGTATPAYSLTVVGTSAATAFLANGVTPPSLSRNGLFGGNGTLGGILAGYGSTADVTLENRNYIPALEIPANTNNVDILQTLEVGAGIGVGTASPQSKIQVLNGEVQVGTSGNACASNNAGAISYNGGLNYCNGTAWTAASPPQGNIYNVISYGADNTGVTASDTAITNAMNACHAGASDPQAGGTVYFPAGKYNIASGFEWQTGCNISADQSAYIQASTSIADIIHAPVTPVITDVSLQGGSWDCNGNATNGFTLPEFARIRIQDITMYNCSVANGGFISLGTSVADNSYEMHINTSHFYNLVNQTPASGNYGIYTPTGGYANNSDFLQLEIVGNQYGVYGNFPSSEFHQVHVWSFNTLAGGFYLAAQASPVRLGQIEVDGPLSGSAFTLLGSGLIFNLSQIEFDNVLNDNVDTAVNIGTGAIVNVDQANFHGADNTHRIAQDFIGDLSNLTMLGLEELNVVQSNVPSNGLISPGEVGIGTNYPTRPLSLYSASVQRFIDFGFSQIFSWVLGRNGTSGNFTLGYTNGSTAIFDILSANTSGDVGIGTLAPINTLDVYGGVSIGTGYAGVYKSPASGLIVQGNVSIGTNTNNSAFLVNSNTSGPMPAPMENDDAVIVGADGQNSSVTINTYGGNSGYYGRRTDGVNGTPTAIGSGEFINVIGARGYNGTALTGTAAGIYMSSNNIWSASNNDTYITFNTTPTGSTGNIERMRINQNGNVGIGTILPLNSFDVDGTGLHIGSGVPGPTTYDLYNNAGTLIWSGSPIVTGTSNGTASGVANYIPEFTGATTLGTSVIYQSGNNIGIGTSSPSNLLSVYSISAQTMIDFGFSPNFAWVMGRTGSNGAFTLGDTNGNSTVANVIYATTGGTVGIGTATVSSSNILEINGSATIGYVDLAAPATGLAIKGNVNIGTTSNPNGYPLLVNTNITGIPPSSATGTTPVQLVAVDGNVAMYDAHAFAANTSFYGWRADGTNRSPSAVQSGEDILILGGRGYEASQYSTGTPISIHYQAGGNWTNSSAPTQMTFNTTPSGATSASLAMEITSSGSIQMPLLASSSAGTTGTVCWATSTGNLTVDTTTTCLLSSLRFKKNIIPMNDALSDIMKMKPITFVYKDKAMGTDRLSGLIAEDVLPIDRTLVELDKDGKAYKIRYEGLSAKNTRAIQQIQDEIQSLKQFPVISHRCVSWLPIMCGG